MPSLYFISCTFKVTQHSPMIYGFAICSSPDDVVTFVFPNGKPYLGLNIWDFKLQHYSPWGQFEVYGPQVETQG